MPSDFNWPCDWFFVPWSCDQVLDGRGCTKAAALVAHRDQREDTVLHTVHLARLALRVHGNADGRGGANSCADVLLCPLVLGFAPPPGFGRLPALLAGSQESFLAVRRASFAVPPAVASRWRDGVGGVGGGSARQDPDLLLDHHDDHVQGHVQHAQPQAVGDVVEGAAVSRVLEASPHVLQVVPEVNGHSLRQPPRMAITIYVWFNVLFCVCACACSFNVKVPCGQMNEIKCLWF